MKRASLVLSVPVLLAAHVAPAQNPPAIARYLPPAPDPRHVFVMDSAHVLSAGTIAALQDSAVALQLQTGADVAWVTLPTLGGRPIEEASVYLGRQWKIGSAGNPGDPLRNRGLLILYVPDKSKTAGSNFRVEVGRGLQGTIIDSRSRAISAAMRDDLRAKRYDAGYMKGWQVAAAMVREDYASRGKTAAPAPLVEPAKSAPGSDAKNKAIVLVAVFGVLIIVIIAVRASRRVRRGAAPTMVFMPNVLDDDDDDDSRRRRSRDSSSSWESSDSSSDSGSSSGGDFGGGGGFDGGGSSDSI